MSLQADTTTAAITVLAITPIANPGKLLALADVSLLLDGVEIVVHGIQIRADAKGAEIALPRHRTPGGAWKTSLTLPEEISGAMGDAVIDAGIEAGVLSDLLPENRSTRRVSFP